MPLFNIKQEFLPIKETNPNIWADHIELFCLLNVEDRVNLDAILDRFIDQHGGDVREALKNISDADERFVEPEPDDLIAEDQVINPEGEEAPDDRGRIKEKLREFFYFLGSREVLYGESYPFAFSASTSELIKRELTTSRRAYVSLLVSSLLLHTHRSNEGMFLLTALFERICFYPFKSLVPESCTVRYFGVSDNANEVEAISGSLFEKITHLGTSISVGLSEDCTPENLGAHNYGDGGLDWVAWKTFGDNIKSVPLFVAQCACGGNWEEKQYDANRSRWGNYLQLKNDYLVYHFIPRSFRRHDGKWENNLQIQNVVLIDRYRMLNLLLTEDEAADARRLEMYNPLFEAVNQTQIDHFN